MVTAIRIDEIKNKIFYELQLDKVFDIPLLTLLELDTGFLSEQRFYFFMI